MLMHNDEVLRGEINACVEKLKACRGEEDGVRFEVSGR